MEIALERLYWDEVRASVSDLNPELARIIDGLSPSKSLYLYKASYPYGSSILNEGDLFLPGQSEKLCLFKEYASNKLKNDLGYNNNSNPAAFVLSKSLELFISLPDRIIPFAVIEAGSIFGIWRILDFNHAQKQSHAATALWDMSAGARSAFMLPKISDAAGIDRLSRKFDSSIEKPKALRDHWNIFKNILPAKSEAWATELLFFPIQWFENLEDPAWSKFRMYLLTTAWRGSEYWRNQFIWDLTFSRIQSDRGIRPSPYVADMVSHLLAVSAGALPGFTPARNDKYLPLEVLQNAFEDVYGSLNYAPIIMEPAYFNINNPNQPVYCSYHYQTAYKLSQKSSARSSLVTDSYNILSLIKKYLTDLKRKDLNLLGTPLYELGDKVDFTCYHHNISNHAHINGIDRASTLLAESPDFLDACNQCETKIMPKNPPFLNGCVKVGLKNKV